MASIDAIDDPLRINLAQQLRLLSEELPQGSPYLSLLQNASSRSELLKQLSRLLATPGLSIHVAKLFKPLLPDLCARWLEEETELEEKLEASALLLEIHPEIFSVISRLLSHPYFSNGPLGFTQELQTIASVDAQKLHGILLAYYRILHANSDLPRYSNWSLSLLSQIIWEQHPDPGVRFLAIRCYALQSGMIEGERVKMEKEVIGEVSEVDCPITWDAAADGSRTIVDGWVLPIIEAERVLQAQKTVLPPQKYYTYEDGDLVEPIHPAELSPIIANVHGVLMLRSSNSPPSQSPLVPTPTASQALRDLAIHLTPNVPTLLTSFPSSGKALLLSHLASILYPDRSNQLVTIHLADTSLDPRSLLGSYVSSPTRPGTFEWKEGVLVKAMREGKWVVFEDIDRGSNEVLGLVKPLVESLGLEKWIGGQAELEVPGRGLVRATEGFSIFATRSTQPTREGKFSSPTFFGAHKFYEVIIQSPTHNELRTIVDVRFPRLAGPAGYGLVRLWDAARQIGSTASVRDIGMRELEKLCMRVDKLLPSSYQPMDIDFDEDQPPSLSSLLPNPTIREDLFFECRDVFFGTGATTAGARTHLTSISSVIAEHLGLSDERRDWVLASRTPDYIVDKDVNGAVTSVTLGRTRLLAAPTKPGTTLPTTRSFAMHKPAISLLSRIASAVSLYEPILLTGETGTGKTSVVTHLASLLRQPLISLNLSNQTEASDIIGGFKPVDARVPATELHQRFLELFGGTFSRKRNAHFEDSLRKVVQDGKWKRAVALWLECVRLAKDRIQAKLVEDSKQSAESEAPRKRRKTESAGLNVSEQSWLDFERDVKSFDVQHVQGNGKFAFAFVEGPLVKALRLGHWILLDEINLASAETLECVSSLLHGPTASITLTEQGSLEPVPRHPNFRLFACMNPATDVGKKDLPPNIRSRFTEIDVPPPDADKDTLLSIVSHYIGPYAVGDKGAIMDVAEFYTSVRTLADKREIADGSNHKPHFSMRTLARALTFAADLSSTYSLRRALWEGCLMAFTMALDSASAPKVTALAQKHILAGVKNPRSLLAKEPLPPHGRSVDDFIKFGPFYLERGPVPEDPADEYIITPSVETKLVDLARIIVTRRFPVLIEGPTSSGKTSSIEYLAKRTGHRFVRINNHEHTDIQEYIGTYVSDPATGKLVFKDGLLVRALRNGDWIVLDELNLAPTDVLEALNRLLDDNRELIIPETQEVVRPHPHFMLFATQNPPGLYGGRKVLSRAFRNRFLEVHFEDVPQGELETILCQRCRIAPSYGQRIVEVFQELQKHRQSSRIFESKHGFATLRDLFRWAGRDAISYQELADNGYMLLAERARREEDKKVVKDILESVMKVSIDPERLYDLHGSATDVATYLGISLPESSSLVWTSAMKRLFTLVARALRFNEPLLLVGETGCGKTSVCQVFAEITGKTLHAVNCHQNTETADLIGSLRPLRNRGTLETEAISEAIALLQSVGRPVSNPIDVATLTSTVDKHLLEFATDDPSFQAASSVSSKLHRLAALFEWHDGPLIHAMRAGDVFLMDEISLADDSVLERLNSVLEPGRTIVLAEQGGAEELPAVRADEGFKLVATMNPGGDFGKKELSPALRNRFTEVWVPAVDARSDLELIVQHSWRHDALQQFTSPLLDFTKWLATEIGDHSVITLRDILAWVEFVNMAYLPRLDDEHVNAIFHHAAHMTFLDGLGSLPQLSAYSTSALARLKKDAVARLDLLFPMSVDYNEVRIVENPSGVQLGSFSVPRGPLPPDASVFSLQAPTTQDNVNRVVRACQLPKPILLEGSPGVGKTSLVAALANLSGHQLCRINLSDQTDLVDLFGSDLPVEGGTPGQFAWKDADFLRALQEGHWVLLDEMNLAPQAVLEGLNAVLDHRGTVYIPELGRSFARHPSFRIFAAQNPLHQGGGRKGLPKSFLNRFTKVYVQELTAEDTHLICRAIFPAIPSLDLDGMINFTAKLHEEAMVKRSFAREGAPWEFNLRDILRWGSLIQQAMPAYSHPIDFLDVVFLQRFRSSPDRDFARSLFYSAFPDAPKEQGLHPAPVLSPHCLQVGRSANQREGYALGKRPSGMLHVHLEALQALGTCIANGWLSILTGHRNTGKNWIIRQLAYLTGHTLHEISVNSATDATDLLGSFEEVDAPARLRALLQSILGSLRRITALSKGSQITAVLQLAGMIHAFLAHSAYITVNDIASKALQVKDELDLRLPNQFGDLRSALELLSAVPGDSSRFEWVDGPLVRALKSGDWVLLDGANLCSPSVLDRLNALCENKGVLTLNEKGAVNGSIETIAPHPSFRLFMTVDDHFGELSRAMRNRGVEIALTSSAGPRDIEVLSEFLRSNSYPRLAARNVIHSSTSLIDKARSSDSPLADVGASARLLPEDSAASAISDLRVSLLRTIPSSPKSEDASAYVTSYAISPAHMPLLRRTLLSPVGSLTPSAVVLEVLSEMAHPHILNEAARLRSLLSLGTALSSDHLLFQSFDSGLYPGASPKHTTAFRALLQLVAASSTFPPIVRPSLPAAQISSTEKEVKSSIEALIQAIRLGASTVYKEIDTMSTSAEDILRLGIRLLSYAAYLSGINRKKHLDHSAIYSASRWLQDSLQEPYSEFAQVQNHAQTLSNAVALTSGHGLSELWTSLAVPAIEALPASKIESLGAVACMLPPELISLRRKLFDLMSLLAFSSILSSDKDQAILSLTDHVYSQLPDSLQEMPEQKKLAMHPMYLIAELSIMSNLRVQHSSQSQLFCSKAQSLIELVVQDPSCDMTRFVDYQQALWLHDANQMSPRSVFAMHQHWLEDLWAISPLMELDGPSILLVPTILLSTISQCDHTGQSLHKFSSEEDAMNRHFRMMTVISTTYLSREYELQSMLLQLLITIVSCLNGTFLEEDVAYVQGLSAPPRVSLRADLVAVIRLLERSNHTGLRLAAKKHLIPALSSEVKIPDEKPYANLGQLWIGMSRLLLELFVPNIPIDPSALQRCTMEFNSEQRALIEAQIAMLKDFVGRTQGNEENETIRYLQTQAEALCITSSSTPTLASQSRTDLGRLHTYWAEVQQFISQVLSDSKLSTVIDVYSSHTSTSARELVVQASVQTFCQRLTTVYPDFQDINALLQTALYALKLGLRLVTITFSSSTEGHSSLVPTSAVTAMVTFPSVAAAEAIHSLSEDGDATATFSTILLRLSAISCQVTLSGDIRQYMASLGVLYEQAYGLWSIDRARESDKEREAQSLYRKQEDQPTDADFEEQDFLTVFPEFGDILDDGESDVHSSNSKPANLVSPMSIKTLMRIHEELFGICKPSLESVASRFEEQRRSLTRIAVQSHYTQLPERLDAHSLPFQMKGVSHELESLRFVPSSQARSYDFYFDENVPEIRKAIDTIDSMIRRVNLLLQQWPDQMVLQHLKNRCEAVLKLSFRSPVAKILSALEQLLTNIEDWEMYANRENSLRGEQQTLIALIVNWRRLELSAWQGLLNRQADDFASGTSEWWFRMYDATIRGVMNIAEADVDDSRSGTDLTRFFEDLVPLLDEFMNSSTLGQFSARLSLLRSMEIYADYLASHESEAKSAGLRRVHRILHATRMYYSQFEGKVSESLGSQRSTLEKEIHGFIKLASWKDVNIHALKQSAQKTHRHLYRIIRRFRDVLRQPVSPLLTWSSSTPSPHPQSTSTTLSSSASSSTVTFPTISNGSKAHLVKLQRTYQNFVSLIQQRILESLSARSFESAESLAHDVLTTSQALSAEVIPSSLDSARRQKLQKNLLTRKRKAWSDFSKEFKRAGVPAAVKADILQQHISKSWVRDQPVLETFDQELQAVSRADDYFYRLFSEMPALRASLADHHPDLATRDLQRATLHAESVLSLATRNRTSLADVSTRFGTVRRMIKRLQMVKETPTIVASGACVEDLVLFAKEATARLMDALQELAKTLQSIRARVDTFDLPSSVLAHLDEMIQQLRPFTASLDAVWYNIHLSDHFLLLKDEEVIVHDALRLVRNASELLKSWLSDFPHLHLFIEPISSWIAAKSSPAITPPSDAEPPTPSDDYVIDTLLLAVQNILAICPPKETDADSEAERDNYLRDDSNFVCQVSARLGLDSVSSGLHRFATDLARASADDIGNCLARVLPFLEQYEWLVKSHVENQANWTRALFKLNHVICSITLRVAKDGFCQPKDSEETSGDAGGDAQEMVDGSGMGEGTGQENVSKDIQDESQVEGLQGDEGEQDEKAERAEEGNAIEMSEDFGGDLQDVPEDGDEEGEEDDEEGSEADPDERQEQLDASDENAIDEKLWGDEQGPDTEKQSGKTDKDHSTEQTGESDVVAKEDEPQKSKSDEKEKKEAQEESSEQVEEGMEEDLPDEAGQEEPNGQDGAPMDEHMQEANTLDLPEDLQMEESKDSREDGLGDAEDEGMEEDGLQADEEQGGGAEEGDSDMSDIDEEGEAQATNEDGGQVDDEMDTAVGEADTHAGDGAGTGEKTQSEQAAGSAASEPQEGGGGSAGQKGLAGDDDEKQELESPETADAEIPQPMEASADTAAHEQSSSGDAMGTRRLGAQSTSQAQAQSEMPNPLRSLGDALKEVSQRISEILDNVDDTDLPAPMPGTDDSTAQQLEYVQEDDTQTDMQALGPARQDEVAKLRDLNIADEDEEQPGLPNYDDMQLDEPISAEDALSSLKAENQPSERLAESESILTPTDIRSRQPITSATDQPLVSASEALPAKDDHDLSASVELAVRHWHSMGSPSQDAMHIWRLYDTLTSSLSHSLCEQLRLILEPTQATRLKGDYRTGKRLNMKKIIPYVASEYTKDKIWLRRTRPSKREYQVLVALDDSKSMAEGKSVHLAFQTLAIVCKALSRLEVGEVAVAKFGQTVDVLHNGFESLAGGGEPFTDQSGAKIVDAFRFDQKATQVLSLLEASLGILEQARERRASATASDLWQLEIIISDGICQDHEKLRTILRRAQEQRVMVVFIILDSLHNNAAATANTTASGSSSASNQNSILSMNQVAYKDVNGRMELTVSRYLDSFPFEYYVVVRDVEALPEVLAGTLKQFFERVSEE